MHIAEEKQNLVLMKKNKFQNWMFEMKTYELQG
jgi:hypothetical protein